ncbi:glycosyltransferase [Herbiconiux solani]|uniref:glycosyltransferase n=1 Tax=Herbiconiux solani TaxID=661329 RepID=UPI001471D243|nr:glycosyltransferase [Herbiconiux solani]
MVPIETRVLRLAGRTLVLGGSQDAWREADGVIVPPQGTSIDTFRALRARRRGQLKVGLWGHVRDYVSKGNAVDQALERFQLRRADQVFAYTPGGTKYAVSVGIPAERVTTVMNSVDTDALEGAVASLSDESVIDFVGTNGLIPGHVVAFVGGLDESKRIDFLAEALDFLYRIDPTVKLLLGGQGSSRSLLSVAVARGQVLELGHVGPDRMALIGRVAAALLMPGRIGLVAVDAMALGLPIITTDWPYHAPEAEYLTPGRNRFDAPDDPEQFALFVAKFLAERRSPTANVSYPTLNQMVSNFSAGVVRMFRE